MGKVDDMRRRREAQHRAAHPDEAAATPDATADGGGDVAVSDADTGACSVCGKVKALQRGVIASHQKGLGTMCPGSRRPPG
jgi:hypothetical protein